MAAEQKQRDVSQNMSGYGADHEGDDQEDKSNSYCWQSDSWLAA